MVCELRKSSLNRKQNVTPIKMLIAQEMSKDEVNKKSQPSLVAKLMGLDDLPQCHQIGSTACRSNQTESRSRIHSGSLDFMQKEHDEANFYKDVFEIWQQSSKRYGDSPQKDSKYKEINNVRNMALIREKFIEAKRLSTDKDALEVLSSNKDLFLKFLQEPNSLLSQNHNLPFVSHHPNSKRITILKPSKLVDGHILPCSGKENGKQMNETVFDKFSKNSNQPTRIVLLKPNSGNPYEVITTSSSSSSSLKTSNDDGFYGDLEDSDPIEMTPGIRESPTETRISSVFSNNYISDESSFSKSEVYYAAGNLSDSDVMSPTSRHSWDYNYINRFGSPFSSSESSVCREAKKRLSERWAFMSLTQSVQEQRPAKRNSSTLGEMLALSDLKKSVKLKKNYTNNSDLNKNNCHDDYNSPVNLVRSNYLPVSSTEYLKDQKDDIKDLTAEKGHNSSFSRLFFSSSRKSSKQKSQKSDDEVFRSSRNISNDGSECVNDIVVKDVDFGIVGQHLPEGFGNANESKDQPNGLDPNKYNLINKSPPVGSVSRMPSWDDSVGPTSPVPGKITRKPLSQGEEEHECFLYVQTLLSAAGIKGGIGRVQSDSVISRWHSYMSLTNNKPQPPVVHHFKQRHQRSFQKLVFDCVNEVLTSGTHKDIELSLMDCVWGPIKKWISGEEEKCVWFEDDDGGGTATLAVMRVVRKEVVGEVVGEVWVEHLRLENNNIKMYIEEKLVEQLVDEFVIEIITQIICAYY